MNNEKAIKIFEEEINHTEQHLRCEDKSPEFYQEMKDWCEALKLGIKALEERPQGDSISRDALKRALHSFFDGKVIDEPAYILRDVLCHIDSAPVVKPCENCDLYFKAMTKEELKKGGAE